MNKIKAPSPWQWLYAAALAAVVVTASGRSAVAAPSIVNFDKLAHFSIYGLMATLVVRPFKRHHLIWAVVIVSGFGISDEIHQSFTPGRSVEFADWIADTLGAVVAVNMYTFWEWYRRLLEKPLWRRKPRIEKATPVLPTGAAP